MKYFSSNRVVHATTSAGDTCWTVTECRGPQGTVYLVTKHTNYDIPMTVAMFATRKSAVAYSGKCLENGYETEKARSERMRDCKPR